MAVAVIVAAACGAPPVRDVFGTLTKEGVTAARELAYSVTPKTPEALLQQGWTDYRVGEYEDAAQKAYSVLSNEGITNHIQANCWYLLGLVDLETGASDAALINLRKAYELYTAGGDTPNVYNTIIVMARADLALGDLDAARERLQTVLSIYDEAAGGAIVPDLGDYHALASRVAAAQHDYETALEHAKQRHAIYQREPLQLDKIAAAKSDLAFWYAVNGCTGEAQLLTVQAARIIFILKDETRHNYNELNWILIHRLEGLRSDTGAVDSIKEWAKAQGDSRVEDLLELALTLEPTKEYADDETCHETVEPQ